MESRTFNYATEVKEEFNDMHYYKNDSGETEEQSTDTKNVQLLRCLQENINNTLEENKGIDEFQSNQGIKIEFECKDEKPDVNSLVSDEVREGIHECQPNQEIKIEFECKDVKPDPNMKAQLLNRKIKKNFIGKELPSKIMPFLIFISLNC
ncbi:hypothetical protein TKK_0000724 [Trichogramma kaykai]